MAALRDPRHILLILLVLSASGCRSGDAAAARAPEVVVAVVGGRDLTRGAFERYLYSALGDAAGVEGAGPEVLSRLLDQFLEEEMLVGEALKAGIVVTDDQVQHFTRQQAGEPDRVRAVLLAKRYKEEVILKDIEVTEDEIAGYFRDRMAEFRRPSRVVLGKILLDEASEARLVYADVVSRPADFEIIAEERSLSPDGGRAQAYEEETLPDSIRQMVATMKEGEISPIVEDPQGFFILRLEDRRPEQAPALQEVRDEIELKLLQEKSELMYRDAVRDLRTRTTIEIKEDRLRFPYQKRGAS
jgi:parvulin-like peptidyl-prolyl isomerase